MTDPYSPVDDDLYLAARRRESAVREVLQLINMTRHDFAPVLDAIAAYSANLCQAPMVRVVLVNDARTHFHSVSARGNNQRSFKVGVEFSMDTSHVISSTIREAGTHQLEDMRDTILYREKDPVRMRLVDEDGVRSCLSVPLLQGGIGIGCIVLSRREVDPFDGDEIDLIETFAELAVIAIENVRQFKALERRTAEVEDLNAGLETRVAEQVDQLERLGRLRRFLSPQVVDAVASEGNEAMLGSHRAMIAILFCDLRGFTAFCESAEPEEAIEVLQTYHETLAKIIHQTGAGFDLRAGDGIMVIFNDPIPCDNPAGEALRVAIAMRDCMADLCRQWHKLGHRLGFGVGISLGYATFGMVGFEGRYDYTASGTAVNLGSSLCVQAADGEILLSPRAATVVEDIANLEPAGDLTLKGFHAPVAVSRVTGLKEIT